MVAARRTASPDRVTFSMRPLGYAIDVSSFADWLATARDRDAIIYARGMVLPRGSATIFAVREAVAGGLIITHEQLAADGSRERSFIAVRTAQAPWASAATANVPGTPPVDEPMEAVWRHIKRAAMGGQPGPTNDELARHCGLKDADAARYQLAKLVSAGRVAVDSFGPRQRRIFTILSGEARGAATLAIKDRGAVIGGGAI